MKEPLTVFWRPPPLESTFHWYFSHMHHYSLPHLSPPFLDFLLPKIVGVATVSIGSPGIASVWSPIPPVTPLRSLGSDLSDCWNRWLRFGGRKMVEKIYPGSLTNIASEKWWLEDSLEDSFPFESFWDGLFSGANVKLPESLTFVEFDFWQTSFLDKGSSPRHSAFLFLLSCQLLCPRQSSRQRQYWYSTRTVCPTSMGRNTSGDVEKSMRTS